ncbi:MAG: FmdB family zinc ribbon protein [Steroidobacteraceae bacterium]
MPFYEYQCDSCGHTLEAMQKVNDAPLKKCPHCGKAQLTRLMSAPVFRLKGGGWYETDFKSDQDSKRNLADRPDAEASKEEKKGATETASKDAAAPDAAKPPEKAADKPAEKAAPVAPDKSPAAGGSAERSSASAPKKAHRRAKPKRPAMKAAGTKPARRR